MFKDSTANIFELKQNNKNSLRINHYFKYEYYRISL